MAFSYKQALSISLTLTIIFGLSLVCSFADLQRFHHPPKIDGSLSFLVVGDWGRGGSYNQSEVAFQMGRTGKDLDIDFVVSTGDNFYENGLKAVNDQAFRNSFTKIYTDNSLQKIWYSVLGNHDYRGDAMAQLSTVLRIIDPRWLCLRSFIVNAGEVEFDGLNSSFLEIADLFFVDTTPFVEEYFNDPDGIVYDWRGIYPRQIYLSSLLKDLELGLRESTAKWKIVVGHHAIRSVSHHGDTRELIEHLLPILEENNVDFYMNGHDHCLQRISCSDSRVQFITSGAGSKAWRGDQKRHQKCEVQFFHDGQGFLSVRLNATDATLVFYDVFGSPKYEWKALKQLYSVI